MLVVGIRGAFVSFPAPFPELMDKKAFVIMERKGDKGNGKQTQKGIAPPRYDEAFKGGAIRMVTEQGRPSTEVANELGICIDTLRSWLKAAGVQAGQADRQNRDSRRNPLHAQKGLQIHHELPP